MPARNAQLRHAILAATVLLLLAFPPSASANEPASLIQASRDSFTLPTNDDVARAVTHLTWSSQAVYKFTGGHTPQGVPWRTYLKWEDHNAQLARGGDQEVDFWRGALARVVRDSPGLEHESFRQYRTDLRRLIALLDTLAVRDAEAEHQLTLDRLEKALAEEPTLETSRTIAAAADLLHQRGQATQVVQALRHDRCGPNIVYSIPVTSVAQQIEGPSHNTSPVQMTVDCAAVRGESCTTAFTRVDIPDNDSGVRLAIRVTGISHSRTRAYKDRATVCNTGELQFCSTATMLLTPDGQRLTPFESQGTLATRITGVGSSARFSSLHARLARRVADRRQPIARAEAERKSLAHLNRALHEQFETSLQEAESEYRTNFETPMRRLDILPAVESQRVRHGVIETRSVLLSAAGLGAAGSPAFESPRDRPAVTLHESAMHAAAGLNLASRRISLTKAFAHLDDDKQAAGADESKQLYLTFDAVRPVTFKLASNEIVATLHAKRFDLGPQQYAAMDVRLAYKLDSSADGPRIAALPPQVLMPLNPDGSRPRVGIRNIAMRRVLLNTLKRDLPTRLDLSEVLRSLADDNHARVTGCQSGDAWLQIQF